MTQINTLEIPSHLYSQIHEIALSQSRSVNDQIVALLQHALEIERQRQTQANVLKEIHQSRWTPPANAPDSVEILREARGYDD